EAKRVTDEMLLVASEAVADQIKNEDFEKGLIYPPIKNIREVSKNVAIKVAEEIFRSGLARVKKPKNLEKFIKSKMYEPLYK
ncbi:MAG: NAD-dependent malic enzyme, partial [Ignavibacteriaceae bacterium]|nr:NAD-dependent malic enzyme [Ignavibacteriaceae bacterium]